jgi:hypothetical protein
MSGARASTAMPAGESSQLPGEKIGLVTIGRGFDVAIVVSFGRPLSAWVPRCATAWESPTGALARRLDPATPVAGYC